MDLYANVVFPDGTILYPQGTTVLAEPGNQFNPRLSAGNSGALMAFVDQARTVNDVRALRLDENADVLGEPFYVNVSGNAQYLPKLAAGAAPDGSFQMLVFWQDARGEDLDGYAARIDAQGITQDATALPVAVAPGTQIPGAVVFSSGSYWAVFADERGGDRALYVSRISPDGTLVDANGFLLAGGEGDQEEPHAAVDGQGGIWVAFTDRATNPNRVRLAALDAGGSLRLQADLSDPARLASTPFWSPAILA